MSVYLLEPPLTNETIVTIFERLVSAETRKLLGYLPQMQEGFQTGYIFCLTDFFGSAPDETNQQAYENGQSYIHVIEEIVNTYLTDLLAAIKSKNKIELEDFEKIDREVVLAVASYLRERPVVARTAIQSL